MSEFKREERYIVIKLSDLDEEQLGTLEYIVYRHNIPRRESVVIESDWPIYDDVWDMVEELDNSKDDNQDWYSHLKPSSVS